MPNSPNSPSPLSSETFRLLIAEDDDSLRDILQDVLQKPNRIIQAYKDGQEAIQALRQSPFDIVITDLRMSGADGLQVLQEAKRSHPHSIVIIMTGYASLDTAILAIRGGAYDYIRKPFKIDELEIVVHNACEKIFLMRENQRLLQRLQETMAEMKKLRQSWDENLTHFFDIPLSPERTLSEMDLTLKQIPPDYDLRRKDSRERVLQDLEKLIRLKREGSLDEKEFLLLKNMLLKKVSE
jgi:DNA-binding response OmpR family regulator